jgi:hypothetical protein
MSVWIFATGRWHIDSNGSMAHLICGILLGIATVVAVFVLFFTPAWISMSSLIVKRAIENAHKNNYDIVRSFVFTRGWLIFPLPKYTEIVQLLRNLCKDRKTKPPDMSSEFSQYVVLDDWGNYVLTWEGKEKLTEIVNSGWFNAEKAENFTSPKTFKILMRIVVIVAVIRGIFLVIHLFSHH